MQNDIDSRFFASSPMLLSLKDRKTTLETFVNNYASDSLEYNGPMFGEDVVTMMYVAVDCIANSRSITALHAVPCLRQSSSACRSLPGRHLQLGSQR